MMKRQLAIVALFAITALKVSAQQDPYYTFFMFNQMVYNPAYAGSKDAICATATYKKQWSGFVGSPEFQTITVNSPVGKKLGVGLGIINDKIGFQNSLNAVFNLSYKFQVGSTGTLAVGAAGGFMQKSLDGTKMVAKDDLDPKIPISKVSASAPDVNAGLWYTNPSIYNLKVGLSATHLMQSTITYQALAGNVDSKLATHYYLNAGIEYPLTGSITLEPNILVKKDPSKVQVDINAFALFNNKIRGGVLYRTGDALTAMVGYKVNDNLHFGYAYDFTTTGIKKYSGGSHELYVTYCFKLKTKVREKPTIIRLTPRYL
ncbi:MAG: type IX secretion system membrane protein PorP/SprF [Bacteroidia bacterium]|jgi:type IX secretion system PorP/SprF family membrane protein|nr:type IX secretion system membrane protein PorP/SprF [Bacteroidia bacterium]MBP7260865.1 type IX secretion system membrane protein PorP/SprF [Bacteroidia bacterium]MBP9179078.1 type IX secretion system membrane protein PorP/SprF [Bacteroidia bacterium]MBP9725086.1 type IX secretion system membrane protein PorP/SprF [Bacteroidia bacterium]